MQVFGNGVDDIVAQALANAEGFEADRLLVVDEALQSASKGSYPYLSGMVAVQGVDVIVGKGRFSSVLIRGETDVLRALEVTVEAHQPVNGAHPDAPVLVFGDVAHLGVESVGRVVFEPMSLVIEGQLSVGLLDDKVETSVKRTYPDAFFRVNKSTVYVVATDAGWLACLVPVMRQQVS